MKQTISALFDTNVLFGHKCRQFISDVAYEDLCECYWSPHIIGELYRVLTVRKLGELGFDHAKQLSKSSKEMMDIMEPIFYCVNSYSHHDLDLKRGIRDKDDFHLYQAAVLEGIDYIVTNNGKDLKSVELELEENGVKVVNFNHFVDIMTIRAQEM